MTRYTCSNPSCPKREPVTADAAPRCYTCDRPMAEVATDPYVRVPVARSLDGFSVASNDGPLREEAWPLGAPTSERDEIHYAEYPRVPVPPLTVEQQVECLTNVRGSRRPGPVLTEVESLYISLHDQPTGERNAQPGPELSYPGYRRIRVDRRSEGRWPERLTIEFPHGTASCWARFFGISHSETGTVLWFDEIHPHIYIDDVVTPQLILNSLGRIEIAGG